MFGRCIAVCAGACEMSGLPSFQEGCQAASRARQIYGGPGREFAGLAHWTEVGRWPARWIHPPDGPIRSSGLMVLKFSCPHEAAFRIFVTASGMYALFLDGELAGRGPEDGWMQSWYYDTYDVQLRPGQHTLSARVWTGRPKVFPNSRPGIVDGFLLQVAGPGAPPLSTGEADWRWVAESAVTFGVADHRESASAPVHFDFLGGNFEDPNQWASESKSPTLGRPGCGPEAAIREEDEPLLVPSPLPPLLSKPWSRAIVRHVDHLPGEPVAFENAADPRDWVRLLSGESTLEIPAGSQRRVLIDLDGYVCFRFDIQVAGGCGTIVKMRVVEALFSDPGGRADSKVHRDSIEDGNVVSPTDSFLLDGLPRTLTTPWFRSGRYVELSVLTGEAALCIESIRFGETRLDLPDSRVFECDDQQVNRLVPVAVRTLQACSHWTLVDCPYYEQGQWLGDCRIQALCHYVAWPGDDLIRKLLTLVAQAPLPHGIPQAFFPGTPCVFIPSFGLWWVCMVHDFARWRGDRKFVRTLMPAARSIVGVLSELVGGGRPLPGWKFADWADGWPDGCFPGAEAGEDAFHRLVLLYTLEKLSDLEVWLDEPEHAARWRRLAHLVKTEVLAKFWCRDRQVVCDTPDRTSVSEHCQALAVLCDTVPASVRSQAATSLDAGGSMTSARLFFRHYVFEALLKSGRPLRPRLEPWFALLDRGFRTFPETEEPTRSDCHAWSAHPIYHLVTGVAGVTPAAMGFERVRIRPQPEGLRAVTAAVAHPHGAIRFEMECGGEDNWNVLVELPKGLCGQFEFEGSSIALSGGLRRISLPRT